MFKYYFRKQEIAYFLCLTIRNNSDYKRIIEKCLVHQFFENYSSELTSATTTKPTTKVSSLNITLLYITPLMAGETVRGTLRSGAVFRKGNKAYYPSLVSLKAAHDRIFQEKASSHLICITLNRIRPNTLFNLLCYAERPVHGRDFDLAEATLRVPYDYSKEAVVAELKRTFRKLFHIYSETEFEVSCLP